MPDMYGNEFHFAHKEEVVQWLCGLLSDIHGCVRFDDQKERAVHYGCICRDESHSMWRDENGVEHPWAGCDTEYLDWLTLVVGKAIHEHQKTWED